MKNLHLLFTALLLIGCKPAIEVNVKPTFYTESETEAIRLVLEKETDCFFKGDYECWKAQWSHQPTAMQAWNNDDHTFNAALGWENIDKQGKDWIEKYYKNGENIIHPAVKRESLTTNFLNDSIAFVTWLAHNADADKKLAQISRETRIMVKEKDGWKIYNVSSYWDSKNKIPWVE